ncbi:protein-l-isoaspartate(d-aspartate) o-methyltransferase-like [Stylonychia lemnae]|uniref:protein-L-isoaspartate(D-aspartate) O-methyltransferase n=1 Tax=Stylonychia lemnae TaxID=5949 RepID=A0A078BB87_STYLE|nr:protein-l-isoaspartate(d-aspartate) o-methyltransferase-like [Stylonychia lemnae]|eukprot:CDW91456.1 protein-l-isoaspartate(d-aspartate) o-methyltransferase-like [Stylonychia lemnae]
MIGGGTKKSSINKLIDTLLNQGVIRSHKVSQVMRKVDRADFCPGHYCYEDSPQPINYNATISAPHMHAYVLEWLKDVLVPGGNALDVGSGSGYLCAAFYEMMDNQGYVVGIDHIDGLVHQSVLNLKKSYQKELDEQRIVMLTGDGRLGCPEYAPYNAIHVGAASPEIPQALIEQLAPGGKMIIPVGPPDNQHIVLASKDNYGKVHANKLIGVRYIPLTSKEKQCPDLQIPEYYQNQ